MQSNHVPLYGWTEIHGYLFFSRLVPDWLLEHRLHLFMVYSGSLYNWNNCFGVSVGYTRKIPPICILIDRALFICWRKFANKCKNHTFFLVLSKLMISETIAQIQKGKKIVHKITRTKPTSNTILFTFKDKK